MFSILGQKRGGFEADIDRRRQTMEKPCQAGRFLEPFCKFTFRRSRESGNPVKSKHWMPAFAGMTNL